MLSRMKKPKHILYRTGEKEMPKDRHNNEEGVHPASLDNQSDMGREVREGDFDHAKKTAGETLNKLQIMKKPDLKGLAHGGSVDHQKGINKQDPHRREGVSEAGHYAIYDTGQDPKNDDGSKAWTNKKAYGKHSETLGEMRAMPNPKLKGLAEGGEVEPDHAEMPEHDEMKHIMAEELMSAIDSKDHKRALESIEAIILNCMNRDEE